MKLNEVFKPLFEDEHYQRTSGLGGADAYKKEMIAYFNGPNFLYRGMEKTDVVILGNTAGMHRKSSGGTEFFNILLDYILPEWKDYPNRYESFICTTDKSYAKRYGELFYVIPLDGTSLAVAPEVDFWGSFLGFGNGDLEDEMFKLLYLLRDLGIRAERQPTPAEFVDYLRAIDQADYNEFKDKTREPDLFQDIKLRYKNVLAYYEDKLSPKKFELTTKIPSTTYNEIWFSGKALFVHEAYAKNNGYVK